MTRVFDERADSDLGILVGRPAGEPRVLFAVGILRSAGLP